MNIRRKTVRAGVTASEVLSAYVEAFHIPAWRVAVDAVLRLLGWGGIFWFADANYNEADEEIILSILEADKTDLEKYKAEDFDCDDFAFRLMGVFHQDLRTAAMPLYDTWVEWTTDGVRYGHAVLSYYKDGEVRIIEPQNDDVYPVPENWQLSKLSG